MIGSLPLGDIALSVGAFADATGAALNFLVEEDEMMVEVGLTGTVLCGGADSLIQFKLMVDGTSVSTLPLAANDLVAAKTEYLNIAKTVRLAKGRHVLKLQSNVSTAATLKGATYDALLFAKRLSADAVLAHGVDSKVQLTM